MRRLSSKKVIYKFSGRNREAYTVSDGERVVVETLDAFGGQVKTDKDVFEGISMDEVNPATGPIRVEGVFRGDTICVEIERIKCGDKGVLMCSPELGILREDVRRSRTKIVKVVGGKAILSSDLVIDLNPHVGVIGVAPSKNEFPTYFPGDFGGNMDTVEIAERSRVYLPSFVDGGMVAMGDVHAAMGDGEVCGTGVEVAADVQVRITKALDLSVRRPMIETPTHWLAFAASRSLERAAKTATSDLVRFISDRRGIDFEEAYMIASVAADLKISQVVDPLMAAKMSISKRYL